MRHKKSCAVVLLALLQACATPQIGEQSEQPVMPEAVAEAPAVVPGSPPAASAAAAKPAAKPAAKATAKPAPAQKPLDVATLPPFDGARHDVKEPLRGVKTIDRTVAPEDVWQRIRQGFAMPNLDSPLVRQKTREYAAQPEYLQRMFDRSRIYLFHIVEELEKRNLPTELALLPMVESAFNPMAYSRAHASGLWQFIPGTGRRFSLKQDMWYDGRRDIVASTTAALDYLTKLYEMHGDWHLALASYNWGENAVARAIGKNRKARKPTDYLSLKMPRETRQYVPKLQALKNIIANPAPYNIELDPIPNEPYFTVVNEAPEIDLAIAAKLAEMPVNEFIALNPGFSRPIIRATAPRIVLPADKVDVFHDNLAKHDPRSLVSWQVYRPRRGETLGTIAKKFGLRIEELKRVNGVPQRSWRLPPVMVVPMNANAHSTAKSLPIMYAPPIPVQGSVRHVHVVKPGDTLSSIATRYRVRVAELKRWNTLGRVLQVGQKVYIRGR
jgi:membrane-bound lytic murein transglycosylase D